MWRLQPLHTAKLGEAFKQSDEYKIQQPGGLHAYVTYEALSTLTAQGEGQDLGSTCHNRQRALPTHNTLEVQETLSWKLTVEASIWKGQLQKSPQIDGLGMLQEVLVCVGAELAKLPSPKTKTPKNPGVEQQQVWT